MAETKWTRCVCKELVRLNAQVVAIVGGNPKQQRGIPDRYINHTRWRGWLEFKGPKTKIDPLQARFIAGHNARSPGTAFIVREPNRLEDHNGNLLTLFAADDAKALLKQLQYLRELAIQHDRSD